MYVMIDSTAGPVNPNDLQSCEVILAPGPTNTAGIYIR